MAKAVMAEVLNHISYISDTQTVVTAQGHTLRVLDTTSTGLARHQIPLNRLVTSRCETCGLEFDAQYHQQPSSYQLMRPYRWRPLKKGKKRYTTKQLNTPSLNPSSVQGYQDYADPQRGLPYDAYRPVKKRHHLTPYYQGYRFRPLSPNEQMRVKKRNREYEEQLSLEAYLYHSQQPVIYDRPQGDWPSQPYRFRPDKRLNQKVNPFPQTYAAEPQF
jgi:hypothetical protein